MDFRPFDTRHYETVPVKVGYSEWAATYEGTVVDLLDLRLLADLTSIDWQSCRRAADLACGTGRTGVWLKQAGVAEAHGIDCTPQMLEMARRKGAHDRLVLGDLSATGFDGGAYDLVVTSLVDEHLADLRPLYAEARRLLAPGGRFVLVGYHPHFLMMGIATHFDRAPGQPVAIESHVHLASDHVAAAHAVGLRLGEMVEGVVDEAWASVKPKWFAKYRSHPVSFAMVWQGPG
ncbi:class I SAM-dependent methyltransferase [Thalassobaculum sp.]|uniref:class I SAM-dependent DNA methyltransferase n=1 Tax=Thalassobaculum sp. TaxID=2022740 RepID=UPI0032ECFE5E